MSKIQISITLPDAERKILDARAMAVGSTLARYIRTVLITEANRPTQSTVPTPPAGRAAPILPSRSTLMAQHGGTATTNPVPAGAPEIEQPRIGPRVTRPDAFDPAYDHPAYRQPEEPPAPAVALPTKPRWRYKPATTPPTAV